MALINVGQAKEKSVVQTEVCDFSAGFAGLLKVHAKRLGAFRGLYFMSLS